MRHFPRIALIAALAAAAGQPLLAQRGRPPVQPPPPTPPDTNNPLRKVATGDAYALDYQQQELRVVLSAVAEAGKLNVALSNIPTRRIDLRMGVPASSPAMLDVLRGLVAQNGLTMTEGTSLIRIEGPVTVTPQQQAQQQVAAAQLRLFTFRLKNASAVQLAPVLMQLFSGAGVGVGGLPGQGIQFPGGAGANPIININPGRGAGGGGGGGGFGGAAAGGAGAGRGAAANPANPANPQLATLGALQQLFPQAPGGALSSAAAQIRIVAEENTNSLMVRATAEDWALIQQVILSVDLKPLQVLIEVTIAEVDRTHDLNVGISGTATKTKGGVTDTVGQFASAASAMDFIATLTGGKGAINFNVALNALQSRGDVRVLSLPVIIAQNNRQAILNVGQRVPFVQTTSQNPLDPTAQTQLISYQDVGTKLTITPTINEDGYVNLQVDQTDNNATTDIAFNAPIINEREATTQIFIRDGQTTVVGGLSGNTKSHTTSGIPLLSRIPWIGGLLFGNTQHTEDASELYLFLTPHVISTDADIDRLRNAVKGGSELLHDVPMYHINPGGDTIYIGVQDTTKRPPAKPPTAPDSAVRPRRPPPPGDSIPPRDDPRASQSGVWFPRPEETLG